jgi:hypothetical protein
MDTCHAFRSDGPLALKLWPQYYTGPADDAGPEGGGS